MGGGDAHGPATANMPIIEAVLRAPHARARLAHQYKSRMSAHHKYVKVSAVAFAQYDATADKRKPSLGYGKGFFFIGSSFGLL
jgi:hypothetical protein